MAENPLRYSDMVSPDVEQGFSGWIEQMKALEEQSKKSMAEIKSQIEQIKGQMSSGGGRSRTKQQAEEVKSLSEIYKKLGVDVQKYSNAIKAVEANERERNNVIALGKDLDRTRLDSYDQLSVKYRALKQLVNNMTQAERENTEEGRKMVENLKEMYEQMNKLQQATGKYQLQVGQYGKAVQGLNSSMTQVIRELPSLAISPSTFAIAISNNLPILGDYIQKVRESRKALFEQIAAAEAAGEAEKAAALKATAAKMKNLNVTKLLVKSIFSWQTALVLVLTVLPRVLQAIKKKREAQEDLTNIIKNQIDVQAELNKTELEAEKSAVKEAGEMKILYEITQDVTRSMEERLNAAKQLQSDFPTYFGDIEKEKILNGEAKKSYDDLTESIMKRARSQVYMQKFIELEQRRIELQDAYAKEEKNVERYRAMPFGMTSVTTGGYSTGYNPQANLNAIQRQIDELNKLEEEYFKRISAFGLDDGTKGKGTTSEKGLKIGNYYYEMMQASVDAMEDGIEKSMAQLTLSYSKEITKYEDIRADLLSKEKDANAEERREIERQIANVTALIEYKRTEYQRERQELFKEAVQEEIDNIKIEEEDYSDIATKAIKTRVKNEKDLRNSEIWAEHDARAKAGEDLVALKEETNAKLLESEIQYWEDYLKLLSASGEMTIEEYNAIMSKIYSLRNKGTSKGSKNDRNSRSRRYGGVFEFLAAQSDEYGTKDQNEIRKVKEEYLNYFVSIDKAMETSMKYMGQWMDTRVQMAEIAVESAQREQEAAKTLLDYELEARANGYANNVTYARKEYEERRKLSKKAAEDAQRLADIQSAIDTAQQASSLVTATANIWSKEGLKGVAGIPLAVAATTAMWGSFLAAKVKASQLSKMKTEQYGEGMSEYLNYGGSHASGHDIDFGMKPDGTRRRVERGEMIGVINKRNVRKYGAERVSDIISSLNHGTFEQDYLNAFSGGVTLLNGGGADLRKLESGVSELVEQGGKKTISAGGKTISYYKNVKRVIKS